MSRSVVIRLARAGELPRLREVERAAGEVFREVGMDAVADDDPPSVAELSGYLVGGQALVAVDDDAVVGYLLLDRVDDAVHVEQVSVHPSAARRGVGRALLEAAQTWAADRGVAALTLTTFADVAWNAPYYARLGFGVVPEEFLGPQLSALRRREHDRGLDTWPRVVMRRRR